MTKALFILLLLTTLAGCTGIATDFPITASKTPTLQPEPMRPEPQEPYIDVSFSGLHESALGRVYFRTLAGNTPISGSQPGNGEMRVVLPEQQGIAYIVSAEAEGYVSEPISYTIQISGTNVYRVENGQITSNEVLSLNFQFRPVNTPTE